MNDVEVVKYSEVLRGIVISFLGWRRESSNFMPVFIKPVSVV
jgi:hypothetical protein